MSDVERGRRNCYRGLRPNLRALVQQAEWIDDDTCGINAHFCPWCWASKRDGHAVNCTAAVAMGWEREE